MEGHREQFWHFVGRTLFLLPTTGSPTVQSAVKDGCYCVVCLNHASFRLLKVDRRSPCGPTRKFRLLFPKEVVACEHCLSSPPPSPTVKDYIKVAQTNAQT